MGADHTAGLVVLPGQAIEEVARASQEAQILDTAIDSSGFCQFLMTNLEEIAEFYSHFVGEEVTRERIADLAWECMQREWEFNRRAGFGPEDHVMCDSLKQDAIGPNKMVWDVPDEVVAAGTLDDDPGIRLQSHIFVGSKAPWLDILDDKPTFDEYPPEES